MLPSGGSPAAEPAGLFYCCFLFNESSVKEPPPHTDLECFAFKPIPAPPASRPITRVHSRLGLATHFC